MKKPFFVLLILFLLTTQSFAEEICATIDISTWTQEQKNMIKAITYSLAYEMGGQNIIPTVSCNVCDSTKICFKNPIFDVVTIITGQTILDRYTFQKAQNEAETAKLKLLEDELNTIDSQLETDDTNWAILTVTQQLAIMKKILRREVLKRKLGQ